MNNQEKLNEVRVANDIVEVISSYLPLTKKGKNYFGVCPFHDDTNPSMSVSSEKQIYKCFSCGAGGNVFDFVMNYENIDFKEALNILAKRAGISIQNITVKTNNKKEKYYKMYDLALKMYQNNLNSSYGIEAKDYLKKRGIDEGLIKVFKIGVATKDKDTLTKVLTAKEYTSKELELFGLGNGLNDLYINRIMFPLFDTSNNVVGFSGRIYNGNSDSKYINTRETPIFKKGELLYRYFEAKEFVRNEKKLIIVEGFLDVIRLYSIGIKNVIALMGTSLTKEQIALIKRLSNNIYLCLDGDEAGRKAIYTNGNLLEKENLNVFVIPLSDELDPDEFILKRGNEAFLTLYNNPKEFSDYKMNYLKEGKRLTSIEDQSKYINNVIDEISSLTDEIKQELMLKKIALEFNIELEILRKKLHSKEKYSKIVTTKRENVKNNEKLDKYKKATYILLSYMLNSYNATKIYEKKLNYLPYPTCRYLANEIIYYYKMNGELILADFLTSLTGKEELKELVNTVLEYEENDISDLSLLDEYICVIKGYSSNQEITRLKKNMENEPDPVEKARIADAIRLLKIGVES